MYSSRSFGLVKQPDVRSDYRPDIKDLTLHSSIAALRCNGFCLPPFKLAAAECDELIEKVRDIDTTGKRSLIDQCWCLQLGERLRLELMQHLPELALTKPVQCTYFRKDDSRNWLVSWHQDRSLPFDQKLQDSDGVAVREKDGASYYQPSSAVLEQVVAIRVHLDASHSDNGPLRFLPGSHRKGVLDPAQIARFKLNTEEAAPEVERGGILVLKPLVLHASSKSTSADPRRVLHYVYA